ncbi:MAG: ABC transporter substrate-binding protein [Pseudomonadota bacterium]
MPKPDLRTGLHIRALRSLALCISLVIAASTVFAGQAGAQSETDGSETYDIYMILWRGETEVEAGFRAYIEERDLPFNLIIRSADRDIERVFDFIDEIDQLQPDLVYTWGTPVTLAVAGRQAEVEADLHVTDIPIVFTIVSYPLASGLLDQDTFSGRNLTGVSHVVPLDTQIQAMQAFMPIDRIATIFSPNEQNAVLTVDALKRAGSEQGFRVFAIPVPLGEDGRGDASRIPEVIAEAASLDPQFLYLPPDTFLGANREAFTEEANRAGLATFASTEVMIRDSNALYALVSPYEAVGRLTGRKIEQILIEGIDPGTIPVETLQRFSYQLKMDVAHQLGIYPAMSLLSYVEILD